MLPEEIKAKIENLSQEAGKVAVIEAGRKISENYRFSSGNGLRLATTQIDAVSYAASRMPATYEVAKDVLSLLDVSPTTIIDIGAGTGASALAALEIFPFARITAIEREKEMSKVGQYLCPDLRWIVTDYKNTPNEQFSLVMTSYVLNELPESEIESFCNKLALLSSDVVVMIDKGTPDGFERLKRARKYMEELSFSVFAPCATDVCPLKDDWCAFYVRVERSRLHKDVKGGEAGYEDEKYSYLAFSKVKRGRAESRILRHPEIGAKIVSLKLCTPSGIEKLTLSKRDGERYKKAKKSKAGDIFE